VRSVLEEVRATLGAPVGALCATEVRAGAVNDIVKVRLDGIEHPLALRCRRVLFPRVADSRLAKDAVCAYLTSIRAGRPIPLATLDRFLERETGGDLDFELSAHVHMFRHAPNSLGPGPWSLCDWIEGEPLLQTPTADRFWHLGARLAALHLTRFESFAPDLDQPLRSRAWRDWYGDLLGFFGRELLEAPRFASLGKRLQDLPLPPEPSMFVLIHGDLHPANVLATPRGIQIVDWDEAQIGPPELDFPILRHRAILGADGRLVAVPGFFDAFVAGYRASGGRLEATLMAYAELLYLVKQLKLSQLGDAGDLEVETILSGIGTLLARLEFVAQP
jgi:hypothetical protein